MLLNDVNGVGRIAVRTLKLPEFVKRPEATYTYSGKVLVHYYCEDDPDTKNYLHIAIVNDDGTGFHEIFVGVIPEHPKANGVRFMPFKDNKRVLLGDYVLECSPDIDNCEKSVLVPLAYPWGLQEDERVFKSWSEVIIAPDNEHICWTTLTTGFSGSINAIGKLVRETNRYVITNPQVISSSAVYDTDPEREGYVITKLIRGGEVKQFIKGGTAISLAGPTRLPMADSSMQDLLSDKMTQITYSPGYDETTIFSPDEKLGLVMSTRGSAKTNFAVLSLMPRPNAMLVTMRLFMGVYMYSVAGVRSFREGNIGPVLVETEKSMNDRDYQGTILCDTEGQWVYCSPMSWHPCGTKVMWREILRGTTETRIRIADLLDYTPSETVPVQKIPDTIPYGLTEIDWTEKKINDKVKIAAKVSGLIEHEKTEGINKSVYQNYSDDGKTFINGYEEAGLNRNGEMVYKADIKMTGEKTGTMKLGLTFSKIDFTTPPQIIESYGYAEYEGIRIDACDMKER